MIQIETSELTKKFGNITAVNNLNLEVKEKQVYGFLGRNGAGKTTTIKLLLGLLRPTSGNSKLIGCISDKLDALTLRQIGYVAQNQRMYDWMTVNQIINFSASFYPDWDNTLKSELLKKLELPEKQKLKTLSQGMKTKLALLLALCYRPKLLILDEPFAGLDALFREEFLQTIIELFHYQEGIIFFSSHEIDEVEKLADHVGIIDKGELKLSKSVEDLKQSTRRIRLSFSDKVPDKILIDGILSLEQLNQEVILTLADYNESKSALLRKYHPENIDFLDMDLREIFIAYAKYFKITSN